MCFCAQAAVNVIMSPANMAAYNTKTVIYGSALTALLGSNADRVPDLFVVPVPGTVYTGSLAKVSDHGGAFPLPRWRPTLLSECDALSSTDSIAGATITLRCMPSPAIRESRCSAGSRDTRECA